MYTKQTKSLASKKYWDTLWLNIPHQLRSLNPYSFIDRRFCKLFDRFFQYDTQKSMIEIGCAYSRYLEYFSKKYGYNVSGLDYSEIGCEITKRLLKKKGIKIGGKIYCRDVFKESDDLSGNFDIVVSFGVVEHYQNWHELMECLKGLLKKNGVIFTMIPNTSGLNFLIMKYLNNSIYKQHCIIDREKLSKMHQVCGLDIVLCQYYGSLNYGVVDLRKAKPLVKRFVRFIFICQHKIFHRIFDILHLYPETRFFSPYIVCIAKKSNC